MTKMVEIQEIAWLKNVPVHNQINPVINFSFIDFCISAKGN